MKTADHCVDVTNAFDRPSRREFIAAAGIGAALCVGAPIGAAQPSAGSGSSRPNIVLIVADDLGSGELGVQGSKDVPTPNIDSIAQNGVRFTDGYVSCPVCSPTRAGMLTGRYQQRFGHEFNPGPPNAASPSFGLPLTEKTIADRLKALGYATGMVGKWHLGYRPELHPMKRGFDEFFGFLAGSHPYEAGKNPARDLDSILRGTEPVKNYGFLTETFATEAAAFIERRKSEPFFLYLPFNAVHGPMQITEKYLARFAAIQDEKRRTFAAMLSALDDGVGVVLQKLRELQLEEKTLVIFISDNGGPTEQTTSRNGALRGLKGQVFEGGIRVPFFMQWKGRIQPAVYAQPVIALDVFSTILGAAGGATPDDGKLDGVDLLPNVRNEKTTAPHDALYWRFGEQSAVRVDNWKLVRSSEGKTYLFDLSKDVGETTDLSVQFPDKVKELESAYSQWNAQLMPPRWDTPARAAQTQRRAEQQRDKPAKAK